MPRASTLYVIASVLLTAAAAFDRIDEECEACGLVFWRMQAIVAEKEESLADIKRAKEKRARQSTKAHTKRQLKQAFAVELTSAIESNIEELPNDQRITGGACRMELIGTRDSALREAARVGPSISPSMCQSKVKARVRSLIGDLQDELTSLAVAGQRGAGAACAAVLEGCSAARATHLLGPGYREGMSARELADLEVGFSDESRARVQSDEQGAPATSQQSKQEDAAEVTKEEPKDEV
jgi:hypothetical protein